MNDRQKPAKVGQDANEGLVCPKCKCRHFLKNPNMRSKKTTYVENGIKRIRYCRNCGWAIVTVEKQI